MSFQGSTTARKFRFSVNVFWNWLGCFVFFVNQLFSAARSATALCAPKTKSIPGANRLLGSIPKVTGFVIIPGKSVPLVCEYVREALRTIIATRAVPKSIFESFFSFSSSPSFLPLPSFPAAPRLGGAPRRRDCGVGRAP